jgi:putative transposase
VSRSGFHAWHGRGESRWARKHRRLDALIRAQYKANKGRSGSFKIAELLQQKGHEVSRSSVARRMKAMGLRAKPRRKYRKTTDSSHSEPVAANLLNRRFTVDKPDQVWVTDITHLNTQAGWGYLTVFLDLFSRMVVGWAVSSSLSHVAVVQALWRAVGRRKPEPGLMIHSDRGVQYACAGFRSVIDQLGFVQSMSRKGDCWDNAVAESFFRTLKTEWYYDTSLLSVGHAQRELFEYIERYYNGQRLHATLGYLTPMQYEAMARVKCA